MNDEEMEQKYQAFLQREKDREQKMSPIELRDAMQEVLSVTAKLEEDAQASARSKEITKKLKEASKKNLMDAFYIDIQIAMEANKDIATNKKLRYDFARDFIQRHWAACIAAEMRVKDFLNV